MSLKIIPFNKTCFVIPQISKLSNYNFGSSMLSLKFPPQIINPNSKFINFPNNRSSRNVIVCGLKGPRPRYPRVWKTQKRIGTISKSEKLVDCVKALSNVKEEVYGALDSFIAWDLEFPLITVKKALKTLEHEKEWKRVIQVTKWMLSKGQGRTMGSYHTLLNALGQEDRLEEAEELWTRLFRENLDSTPRMFFDKMISIYYKRGMHDKMFDVFADMEELGLRPTTSIVSKVGDVFKKLGMIDKYEKLYKKYPPPKWEYRYIKGKRVKVRSKHPVDSSDENDVEEFNEQGKLNGSGGTSASDKEQNEQSSEHPDDSFDENVVGEFNEQG